MAIRLLIADDHPLMAEGIAKTFEGFEDIEVKAIVSNGREALDLISEELFDIVLLDIEMPILNGIDCAKEIIANYPEIKVAMLSMHQEASIIKNLIEMGVKGYLLKTIPQDELILAVRRIYQGREFFNASITKALLNPESKHKTVKIFDKSPLLGELTAREREILELIAKGSTNAEIGDKLFISTRTVDTHRNNIMKKLNIRNVAGLVRFAFQNGLI